MNILKSFNQVPQPFKKLKFLMGKIFLSSFFFVCVKFHGKIFIKCIVLLGSFGGIAKMFQGSTNHVCALISQHNVILRHKPSSITKF
jgi:hypothetical protein